ncbi:MAG: two-component system, chemotaxis family, sensor kinase CheA [Rhodocyclales bacterium]|nr:two-component system, chemotaxis family, sensor kinase CheA [Rhodocyclales bacterium]
MLMNLQSLLANWRRLLWISLAPVALTAGAAIFLDRLLEEQALAPIRIGEMQRALRRAESLQRSLGIPVDDIISLSRTASAREAARSFSPAALERFAEVGAILAETGISYEKVRLIDANGIERLRLNLKKGYAIRVPEGELQDKSSRYFFSQARDLPEGKVFFSRNDLNVENGKIEEPYVSTLRVSTPLRSADGRLAAMLVLNIAVDELAPMFRTAVPGATPLWMVDHEGFWLKGPRPELEWGFQLGRPDARLDVAEPRIAEAARAAATAQITTPSGLWTLARVDPPRSPALAGFRPGDGQFRGVTLISKVPMGQLHAAVARTRELTVLAAVCVCVVFVLATMAILLAFEARKHQAREAEKARHRLRLALIGGGLSMWIAELTGAALYLNASWQKITGYPQGPSTMDAWLELMHVDDRASVVDAFQAMAIGQHVSIELPLRLRHQDGHWITLGLYGGVVEYRHDGRPSQAAGVLRDLSEIEQSEKRLELALHGGDMSWWDWNVPGNVVKLDVRWGQLTGETATNATEFSLPVASVFEEMVHLEDRGALSAAIAALVAGQRSFVASEYRLRRRDGGWTWVLARGEVMERSESGVPTRVLGTFKDITPRKHLEIELKAEHDLLEQRVAERTQNLELARQQAEDANIAKNTFLANISHEMRTPMHGIIGFADMGRRLDATAPHEMLNAYFVAINQSATRLLSLLNDLLDTSKLESGMMSFHPQRIEPAALVDSNVAELEPLARQKNLRLQVTSNGVLPMLFADPIRIGQVIRNLLANSIRYSPDGNVICVDMTAVGGDVLGLDADEEVLRLVVSDNGCGIPGDELESIFDKFVQSTRTRSGAGGTGLGLSICRDILVHHRGRIRAFNNAQGGASFEVLLPGGIKA